MILHKKKNTLNRLCCIMKVTKQTLQHLRKKVPLANTIHHSTFIYNQFKKLNLCKSFSNRVIGHLMSILSSIFISGYHGKTTDFAQNSSYHRTTIAHFLNSGKWDDTLLENTLKSSVVEIIYSEAQRTGKPVFCIVDDTIASKTKPSSQALHPIEDAYFHQSHLKRKQDYGHQAVAVMLSCNGIVLNYAFVLYNKSISKIDIVQNIAKELPEPPVMSYFLCDCWYVCKFPFLTRHFPAPKSACEHMFLRTILKLYSAHIYSFCHFLLKYHRFGGIITLSNNRRYWS